MREMETGDWASLSDEELLERRISKLGLRFEGTTDESRRAIPQQWRKNFAPLLD